MKHVIWQPAIGEVLPDSTVAYQWGARVQTGVDGAGNPVYGMPAAIDVVAAIVADDFATAGTLLYDSADPAVVPPWPLIHTFAGWGVHA